MSVKLISSNHLHLAQHGAQPISVRQDYEPADESPDTDSQVYDWAETDRGDDQECAQDDLENSQEDTSPDHAP